MYDVHNLLLCFLHRRESESLPTVNATIHQCVMCRAVESAVYERPFVVVSVFSRPYLWCFE